MPGDRCDSSITHVNTTITIDLSNRYWTSRSYVGAIQADSGKIMLDLPTGLYNTIARPVTTQITHAEYKPSSFLPNHEYQGAIPIQQPDSANNFYLQIRKRNLITQPLSYISLRYAITQYGAVTIPFKYRFANKRTIKTGPHYSNGTDTLVSAFSEATASFNLALYIGRKWGATHFFFDPAKSHNTWSIMTSWFLGPAIVSLSQSNIENGYDITKTPSQILCVSTGPSLTMEWNRLNFGFYGGLDMPLKANTGWVYRGKPWLGFGIGFNLGMFSKGNSDAAQ
ncbi:MAG: hypothetical protein JO072_16245 [Parafilimonas sp.]|nr:hypothetical protein [Parafilimonas sp.]